MKCRHCNAELTLTFVDMGAAPPSNAYLTTDTMHAPEKYFPLRVFVCNECWLVQTEDYVCADELFHPDYAYFSSTSTSWIEHTRRYCEMIRKRLSINKDSLVIEVASNDGYLLRNFVVAGIPCLGIEPTDSTADIAEKLGIPVIREFFGDSLGKRLAAGGRLADLIIGNNVYAHVPDINDFTSGLKTLLKPNGTITLEFPYLMRLIEQNQLDTIYHEHYSYLSLTTVKRIFVQNGLNVFDVEELPTHGGSLRVYGQRSDAGVHEVSVHVTEMIDREAAAGMMTRAYYAGFQAKADKVKNDFLAFLIESKRASKTAVGYGAAAKGNTLLNYAGVRPDLLPYVVDRNPAKQGKYLPGSRIPIMTEEHLKVNRPDYVVILPWNLQEEVMVQLAYIRGWGGQFVTAVPSLKVS